MNVDASAGRKTEVRFTGMRGELFGTLLRGYLLMVPTIGVYRFWLVTQKRRFYWSNTEIDGDPLEYTGNAMQLLIGFLIALLVFVPVYAVFFFLSTQDADVALLGYGAIGVLLWFLMGYAIYRARDFRLSRTLWRGIRFDQTGNAWNYALRRFGWSILVVVTLGLAYPFMTANLWRYRYNNTWFGDRQFSFSGSWKLVARPYYLVWAFVTLPLIATIVVMALSGSYTMAGGVPVPTGPDVIFAILGTALVLWLGIYYYQGREVSRMFSTVRLGAATVATRVRGRSLLGQLVLMGLTLAAANIVYGIVAAVFAAILTGGSNSGDEAQQVTTIWGSSFWGVGVVIFGYLIVVATFSILSEIFLGYGYWMLVAKGSVISNVDSLQTVRGRPEDHSLAGEGLADALNVGAY
jgi:uncharacterized membrane protein YjgN (DUF898 family)